jgi:uncharacterized membrane protein
MSHHDKHFFEKDRLQALSDGVFSIVMTLLVLNLIDIDVLGAKTEADLHRLLTALWPKLISYIISFVIAARFWVAQHVLTHNMTQIDLRFIWLNALFLFFISMLPFSAALLGEHHQYAIAEIVYGANMIMSVGTLGACGHYAVSDGRLVKDDLSTEFSQVASRRILTAIVVYAIGIAISLVNPHAGYVMYVLAAFLSVLLPTIGKRPIPI